MMVMMKVYVVDRSIKHVSAAVSPRGYMILKRLLSPSLNLKVQSLNTELL